MFACSSQRSSVLIITHRSLRNKGFCQLEYVLVMCLWVGKHINVVNSERLNEAERDYLGLNMAHMHMRACSGARNGQNKFHRDQDSVRTSRIRCHHFQTLAHIQLTNQSPCQWWTSRGPAVDQQRTSSGPSEVQQWTIYTLYKYIEGVLFFNKSILFFKSHNICWYALKIPNSPLGYAKLG